MQKLNLKMENLILIGNGGHCKACIEIIESSKNFKIKGIIVHPSNSAKEFMSYKVLGNDNNIHECFDKDDLALICVGQIKSPDIRIDINNLIKKNNISLVTLKSIHSIVSNHAEIGSGSIVMHNAIVNAGAKVGENCILNTNSLIEHDVQIGDYCHISTGAIVNGGVEIGYGSFIGSGSIIKEGLKIGDRVIISAGQIVMSNIPSNTKVK